MNPSMPEPITSPKVSAPVSIDCSREVEGTSMATNDPSTPESPSETTSRSAAWRTPLLWAAGVDTDGQWVTTRADRARYGSQGASLVLLGFIAAASVLLAGSQIGLPVAATIVAAIVWGSMVFFISRATTYWASTDDEPPSRRRTTIQIMRIAPMVILLVLAESSSAKRSWCLSPSPGSMLA